MSRRVVLNADDFGYDPAVSRGIAKAMRAGVVSSTTLMVNTPHSEHAATLSAGLAIGLHLNLARWNAVSDPHHVFDEAQAGGLERAFVEGEIDAQLNRLEALVGRPATHVDVHKHLHRHANVFTALVAVAHRRALAVRSIDESMRTALRSAGVRTNDVFLGDAGAEAYWTNARFAEVVASLPTDGLIELMCHPGEAPTHVTSGYSQQRLVELETFCSADASRVLAQAGLRFESWS